jgi:hypothetical protein
MESTPVAAYGFTVTVKLKGTDDSGPMTAGGTGAVNVTRLLLYKNLRPILSDVPIAAAT